MIYLQCRQSPPHGPSWALKFDYLLATTDLERLVGHVYVSIPVWRSPDTVRRAVEAVLSQTHRDLTAIVVNDGDHDPDTYPWPHLADIDDPRLIRFDLPENRGRYFADAVVLAAVDDADSYFTVHDADDAARPTWLQAQMEAAQKHTASAVFCSHLLHGLTSRTPRTEHPQRYTGEFRHHAHMAGLWKTQFLKDLGGPRPDFRVGYDTMLTGAAMATRKCYLHREVLYDRYLQKGSLTKAPGTRIGSQLRKNARSWMIRNWASTMRAARMSPHEAGLILSHGIPQPLKKELTTQATRLRNIMNNNESCLEEDFPWAPCLGDSSLWGTWALRQETACALAKDLETHKPSMIVEAGSGSSTLLFSQYADAFGARVIALESSPVFQKKTQELLQVHGTGKRTEVWHAPLHTTTDGPWYTYDGLPDNIDFALVDGPRERDGGRRAAMSFLIPRLKPGARVILDDTNRDKEQADLSEWRRRYDLPYTLINGSSSQVSIPRVDACSTGGAKVAVTLLTGRRPELLEETLRRMQICMPGLLRRAHVTVLHNGGDEPTAKILSEYQDLIDTAWTTSTLLDIGAATSMLACGATLSRRKYWLHLEDDWSVLPLTPDWLSQAQTILHTRPHVFQVRLRHSSEFTLARHMVTARPLRWSAHTGFRLSPDAHYTNNPSLVRVRDIGKIWPATGEKDAQQRAHRSGLRGVAQLTPGVFIHTGEKNSLRRETKCPA